MSVRIGAVSYLNTKPLIEGLADRLEPGHLILDLPSHLADQLHLGQLDVALIPSVEYFRGPSTWSIISDACIACRGPVRSVRLLFRRPPDEVRTLALDEGSRTSAALSQVLLYERYGLRPRLLPLPITADYETVEADAILIIGDRAMQVDATRYVTTWDLGEEWCRWTGLPFVFAMWIAGTTGSSDTRAFHDEEDTVAQLLQDSRDRGVANVQPIANREAARYHLTVEDCLRYFTEQLHFHLGPSERAGLERFRTLADKIGLIPSSLEATSAVGH